MLKYLLWIVFSNCILYSSCDHVLPGPIFYRMLRYIIEYDNYISDIMCQEDICYLIKYAYQKQLHYLPMIGRMLTMDTAINYAHSYAPLYHPKDLTFEFLNPSLWHIDKLSISHSPYQYSIVSAPFWSDSLIDSNDTEADILMIGLGGGTFNNYYNQQYPKFNTTVIEISNIVHMLSLKWFDVIENDNHRIFLDDGVQYIKRADILDETFDVVLLDASYSDTNHYIISPIAELLQDNVISSISRIVRSKGVVVMNVATDQPRRSDIIQHVVNKFEKHFRMCAVDVMDSFNSVLVCRHKAFVPHLHGFSYL